MRLTRIERLLAMGVIAVLISFVGWLMIPDFLSEPALTGRWGGPSGGSQSDIVVLELPDHKVTGMAVTSRVPTHGKDDRVQALTGIRAGNYVQLSIGSLADSVCSAILTFKGKDVLEGTVHCDLAAPRKTLLRRK